MDLRVRIRRVDEVVVIEVIGEIDMWSAPVVMDKVRETLHSGSRVVLDFSDLRFMDSSGLATLVALARHAEEEGGSLRIVAPPEFLLRMLRRTGLYRRLSVHPDLDAALEADGRDAGADRDPRSSGGDARTSNGHRGR